MIDLGVTSNQLDGDAVIEDMPQFDFGIFNQHPAEPAIGFDEIQAEVRSCLQSIEESDSHSFFLVKPASHWIEEAKTMPIPEMLFGEFWFEGELCFLYSDTNLGKSILAVQIGNSISTGESVKGFKLEASKQKVLYFDFELSSKQFEARYSDNYQDHYQFCSDFLRAEINPDNLMSEGLKDFEAYLNYSLEKAIVQTGARILIIDNVTYLRNETERAKDALPLMKHLKALKQKFGLSILALAHTPKRDLSKPLTRNDLQGSKMLINFCDSAFAIGESFKDKNLRYLKQIKARNTDIIYDGENVCVWQIEKPHNFLRLEFIGFGVEREHLKAQSENEKSELIERVKNLSVEGKSQRQIASALGISVGAVNKYLKK